MADFEDMTGWREELDAWHKSEDYKNRPTAFSSPFPPVPVSKILKYIELVLRNPDCQKAHAAIDAWNSANPGKFSWEDDENFPHHATATLGAFEGWYLWKANIDAGGAALTSAAGVFRKIRNGEFPAVYAPEVRAYLKKESSESVIDFDN